MPNPVRSALRTILVRGSTVFPLIAALMLAAPAPAGARTATPTTGPTPQRTGDLGTREITGRVVDEDAGTAIAGALVEYRRNAQFPPGESGSVLTNEAGEFSFELFLHDTDDIEIIASASGYATASSSYDGWQLWTSAPLEIGLLLLRGSLAITPLGIVNLPCESDAVVTITNTDPPEGADSTIFEILPSNSYSQGDYGTGFTADLSGIDLPLTLAPGEHIAFPVHYSAAGQDFPSRLTVRVRSTANEDYLFGFPYRGEIAGCVVPTPTPTPPTHACPGDCDGNGTVTIAELVRGVALALLRDVAPCANADLDASGAVRVNELVAAVSAATEGCPR